MSDASLQITVGADVSQAVTGLQALESESQALQQQLIRLDTAITNALARGADTTQLEAAFDDVAAKIRAVNAAAAQSASSSGLGGLPSKLQTVEQSADDLSSSMSKTGLTTTQARIAFIDLGRIVTGQGFSLRSLASNFSLLGPGITIAAAAIYGLIELLTRQTEEEKKAGQEAQRLKQFMLDLKDAQNVSLESAGSEQGNIARVQALAAAIRDTNNTYAERKNALDELRETNKAYFGDLTLEADSLKTLSGRVRDYSQALITEAIVKGQVEEIAKVSSELEKQARVLDELKGARDRAQQDFDTHPLSTAQRSIAGATGGGVDDNSNPFLRSLDSANFKFKEQQTVTDKLRQQIAEYNDELQKNIALQLQVKPLHAPPVPTDDLKSIIPILEQIQKIYEDIRKPNKESLFQQEFASTDKSGLAVIEAQIKEAIRKGATAGAKDPAIAQAYADIANALQAKLAHVQNPDLRSHIDFTLANPADASKAIDKYEAEIEKAAASAGGAELKLPVHLRPTLENQGFERDDIRKLEDQFERDPAYAHFYVDATADVQLAIAKFLIRKSDAEALQRKIKDTFTNAAVTGFADVGKAVGDALTGQKNPLGAAIKDFTTILGDGLIKIGEQMILASTIMQGLKTALGGLFSNPAGGIIEGIAAVALGETIKNVGAHAFATGGIVTGPTLGLVGEAGPEVIFPLDRLNSFIRGNQQAPQRVVVEGRISGAYLNVVAARASRLQNLTS